MARGSLERVQWIAAELIPPDRVDLAMENFRLKVFRIVAQHLNFSRAAEELSLSQPAVTQQIKALEEDTGFPCSIEAAVESR